MGWLVVVKGPGVGSSITLWNGQNDVGRDPDSTAPVNFGDHLISRKRHALVIYDHLNHDFYVKGGTGRNLTWLDGKVVGGMTPLESGSEIKIGNTLLRFVALCGDEFRWPDLSDAGDA